ncbi:hypothetical protein AOLI_G00268930 [Acnodon oligacanthus]
MRRGARTAFPLRAACPALIGQLGGSVRLEAVSALLALSLSCGSRRGRMAECARFAGGLAPLELRLDFG